MSYCPFINEICKGNQCRMWSNEQCLIASFLQSVSTPPSEIEFDESQIVRDSPRTKKIPNWIQLANPEDIVEEYFEFIKKEFPDSTSHPYGLFELFLQTKGLTDTWALPVEISMKLQKARALMQIEKEKQRENERQIRFERELMEVDSIATQFLDWMEENSIDKIYKKNINRFAKENNYDLLLETEEKIFDIANKQYEERRQKRLEIEKRELPSLLDQCLDWANVNKFNSITKSDIESFLIEYKLNITEETKRVLYSMVNTRLKSKK